MNVFSRSAAHMELSPAERAALRLLKSLLIAFAMSAVPVVAAQLATGTISSTDWAHTLDIAGTTGTYALLTTLWKYLSAVQDVVKGNTVAKKSQGTPDASIGSVGTQAGPVQASGGIGTLPITQFWATALTDTEKVLNQPSPDVLEMQTQGANDGMVAPASVSSEADAPTVDSGAPAFQAGL